MMSINPQKVSSVDKCNQAFARFVGPDINSKFDQRFLSIKIVAAQGRIDEITGDKIAWLSFASFVPVGVLEAVILTHNQRAAADLQINLSCNLTPILGLAGFMREVADKSNPQYQAIAQREVS
jgi:hypothetical protein